MKTERESSGEDEQEHEQDNADPTPTEAPPRPSATERQTSTRPRLLHSPPVRLSEVGQTDAEEDKDRPASKKTADEHGASSSPEGATQVGGRPELMRAVSGAEEERLAKLREAVNAKLASQQRKRNSYGAKRPSPIREEDSAVSPSLNASLVSPLEATMRPLSTVSTESTESARTVRASVPPTPAESRPLRTPSYPFPYVPGTPRTWSSSFHQPFTNLSPTVTAQRTGDSDAPGTMSRHSSMLSGATTPGASTNEFMPSGAGYQGQEDPRFPTPNLYDMVLALNAEPGLEQWWATVTNLMHDNYKAERVTLIVPLDPTDIENVPWGQKATFSMNGREEFVPHRTVLEQTSHVPRPDLTLREPSTELPKDFRMQKLHPERLRPRLESRHSYAGPGRDPQALTAELPIRPGTRPPGPQRTMTHAPAGVPGAVGLSRMVPQRLASTGSFRHTSLSDPDFSSIAGGADAGPYAEVFSSVKALHHEVRPLIEPSGVERVLERGRVVTVTRDYVSESSDSSNGNGSVAAQGDVGGPPPKESSSAAASSSFGNYRSVFASDNLPGRSRDYEEYEQYPTSPWAQSPAPSPAIQADEEDNPFFASTEEQQVEDSFNPTTSTPKDYSQYNQVEAIGVDHASTIVHVPLMHPALSQPMQSLRMRSTGDRPGPQRSSTLDLERRAPIAILSVLCPTVPYPPNLTHSLKLLGPHLATSFSTAQQFSTSHVQSVTIRHRRTASGHNVSSAPMAIEPASLEDIMSAEIEEPPGSSSISGSITSPSEYSGRSKHSPTSSIAGTPGWDPATHGWTSSKSVTGTPAFTGSEMVDNYFEAKKRTTPRSASNTTSAVQTTPAKPANRAQVQEVRSGACKPSPSGQDESKVPHAEQKTKASRSVKEEKTPLRQITERAHSPMPPTDTHSPQRPPIRHAISHFADQNAAHAARRHSLLHSYGADFESFFGVVPGQVGMESTAHGPTGHVRKVSYPEDMPPPSERLLRTIIDSVPVQIFTAKPDTGQLSWVNSKFLIYRGQEPRQVLSEPWQAIHPDDRSEFMASWHRSLRTAQQLQQKVRLERFDGSFRWFYVRAAPLKDKRQKIVHWIGTMMDFHEQHLAELNSTRQQETAASEAKYRALANSSPQVVFAVSKTKGVTFCNSQWIHYSGQTEAEALGVGFMDHVHPDDLLKCRLPTFDDESKQPTNVPTSVPPDFKRTNTASAASSSGSSETERGVNSSESSPSAGQMPQRKLSELASTGILKVARDADGRPSYSTEVRLKSKEGEFRWHLVRVLLAEPLLQNGNEEETWYGTCTDINDHKTLERDLKENMDEKSRFLSNMSHEIRTPLNGITGMVNFLIDSSLTGEQMEHVNIIRASTEGLRGLINDILDLSKAEAGMIQLNMDWLYIRAIIEEVNDLTSAMAIDKGLELNYVVQDDVPSQVRGDRFRIRQVLLNVVGNAIKFTERGEVFVRCSVQTKGPDQLEKNEMYIKFEVIDTGRGFTDKEAEYLFKRFSQIDGSSTRQHGGTGLGLVISRQLAQLHGGDMSAKGVPGHGSTFTLFIKTTLPSKHDQPPVPPPTPGPASMPTLPISPSPASSEASTPMPKLVKAPSIPMPFDKPARASPKFLTETSQSPSPYMSPDPRDSPGASSASSDPSLVSAARTSSLRSERSSASSYVPDPVFTSAHIKLALPTDPRESRAEVGDQHSDDSAIRRADSIVKGLTVPSTVSVVSPGGTMAPPMYSILVVCPLKYSREATVQHIDMTLPKNIPHQITARENLLDCQKMLGGDDPVRFSHIVVMLQDVEQIVTLMDQIFESHAHSATSVVVITDLAQRRILMEQAPKYDYEKLATERRLRFVFKPLKPSRFAVIFDPQKEREMSTDRNQDSAQQVALTQKQVFEELGKRLGNRDKRVLLVEDNKVNQMVSPVELLVPPIL